MTAPVEAFGSGDDRALLERAACVIRAGRAIIYPTDTFYALGVDPWNRAALDLLYRLKGRPEDKPVLLLIPDPSWAWRLWERPHPAVRLLAGRFWPGPLTIVASPGPGAPPLPPGLGLALRCPGSAPSRALLEATGPLTGTSANRAGAEPPEDARSAAGQFAGGVDLVVDGGTYRGGEVSTIITADERGVRVVRPGAIGPDDLARALDGFFLDNGEALS